LSHKVRSTGNLRRSTTQKKTGSDTLNVSDAGLKIAAKQSGEGKFQLPPSAPAQERPGTATGERKPKKDKKIEKNVPAPNEAPDFQLEPSDEDFEQQI
jgi:hypothetical protein